MARYSVMNIPKVSKEVGGFLKFQRALFYLFYANQLQTHRQIKVVGQTVQP